MKGLILGVLMTAVVWGQTGGATAPPSPPAPVATFELPQNWYGGFFSYNASSSPKASGGGTEASLLSKSAELYSYNTWDVTPILVGGKWTFQTSPRTGLAMILKTFGPIYIIGLGNVGAAIANSNASFAASGGGIVLLRLGQTKWTLFGGYHVLASGALGGTQYIPEFGLGRMF